MGSVCPCPRRSQKPRQAYDVHEQTFQMDENLDNIGQISPKDGNSQQNQNILTDELKNSEVIHHPTTNKQTSIVSEQNDRDNSAEKDKLTMKEQLQEEQMPVQLNSQIQLRTQPKPTPPPQQQTKPSNPHILKPKSIKKKYNPDDYRFINQKDSFLVKAPGSINEQQFNIDNCHNCSIFILDVTANIYIDDCINCSIFIAPCESTIFIRSSSQINMIAACKQFRTYNVHTCRVGLYCKSQPVIQSSSDVKFGCIIFREFGEEGFASMMAKVKLEVWNNRWSDIHDFTKKEGEVHSTLMSKQESQGLCDQFNWQQAFNQCNLTESKTNLFPFIYGQLIPEQVQNTKLLLIFSPSTPWQSISAQLAQFKILKAFEGVVAGEGKDKKIVILIDLGEMEEEREWDNALKVLKGEDMHHLIEKCFIKFTDER